MSRKGSPFIVLSALVSVASIGTAQESIRSNDSPGIGVLIMAHGGSDEWNEGVLSAVEPLEDEHTIEVAFGMADAASIQAGVDALESAGHDRIAVIRLFISADSWRERTEQILGLVEGAPPRPAETHEEVGSDHAASGHAMDFWRINSAASFAMSQEGLAEAPEMGRVLADRARRLSKNPSREDVLLLAHGPADDAENARWLADMDAHADEVRAALPFHSVTIETLREDWPDKRKLAEERIRKLAATVSDDGRTMIVIPFRVHGFGPYAEVLEGYDYVADGSGLVPHERVTAWIERQIETLTDTSFRIE